MSEELHDAYEDCMFSDDSKTDTCSRVEFLRTVLNQELRHSKNLGARIEEQNTRIAGIECEINKLLAVRTPNAIVEKLNARIAELEEALKQADDILMLWECEGTMDEGARDLQEIIHKGLKP